MQKNHLEQNQDDALPILKQRKSSNTNWCDVCFEPYHIMGRWPMLACPHQHFFCDQCIEGMFKFNDDEPVPCPICRALIRHTKVKPHYQLFRAINKEVHLKQAMKSEQNQLFLYAFKHEIFQVAMAFKSGRLDIIAKLTRLDCSDRKICNIQHMNAFPQLVYLRLDRNTIVSPSGLEALSTLRYLNLSHNSIKDISSLGNIKSLTHLALEFNQIQNISSMLPFSLLSHWFLYGNPLKPIVVDQLLLVQFKNLLTLSLSCIKQEAVSEVFLKGLSACQNLPRLSKIFVKGIKSDNLKQELKATIGNIKIIELLSKQDQNSHYKWLQQLLSDSEHYGEVHQFTLDPDSPYFQQYKLEGDKLMKMTGNFVIMNGQYSIRKEGKVNLKIRIQTVCEQMLMGLCNGFIKHAANMYSEHFVGLTFWGTIYCRGDQLNTSRKLRLNDKPVIRMCVDFQENQIRWFSDDNEVGRIPFPPQFKHSTLYFLIGARDKDTVVTILNE